MKTCRACGKLKEFPYFSRLSSSPDGRRARCKECIAAIWEKDRDKNLERGRAYKARPGFRAADKRRTRVAYPHETSARDCLTHAIQDGRIQPWPVCAIPECNGKPQGHHADYDQPLLVTWLCAKHHMAAHALGRLIADIESTRAVAKRVVRKPLEERS